MDDSQLIEQILSGDTASYAQLVRKYQDRLFNTLLHFLGSREDAEDVVQESFVQAYLKLATFQGNSLFYTWLYRIAFNVAVSHRRRRKPVYSVDLGREIAGCEPVDGAGSPEQRLQRHENVEQVRAALETLSEEHRVVLVLREMEGLEYDQIAEVLNTPIGTVRSRLHRARAQLRDHLHFLIPEDQREMLP
ncbi:sigma-70 family RNA polymerase sigma factor [Blastopirellula sp. JC732]|uniref:RNA polymerase sigma factor n=1 Tax=Blastopirellula sediminis TaxID=2894196 RepID=A0A9X1MN00_9BACT|nr:sigma-70 family RNA polymerase sigma factor [Blastopirellula sediminis]MCC9607440.1 sigma-70 family RNA polymerase sigma factor [Blastopirellula sediminis]MCC9629267.1 sigma-70 family RNA polymerase sigma factor [Blastopirellula sediminis]